MAFELNAPSKIKSITSAYTGPRFRNGRPKVDDDIVERMKRVTIEEAWGVLMGKGHSFQFEGDWINLHPSRVLVGRAVTARYIPHRPDFDGVVNAEGERHGRIGGQNSWVIDTLVANDVLVVDLFGKVLRGTFIGDNLGTAIAANTDGTGLVVDGGIRDDHRVRQLPINVLCKGLHPSAIGEVTMAEINGPVRVGEATCMPGRCRAGDPHGRDFRAAAIRPRGRGVLRKHPPARLLGQEEHCRRPLHARRGRSQVVAEDGKRIRQVAKNG